MSGLLAGLTLTDGVGILGSLLIMGAYLAVSTRRLDGAGALFQALNLVGAVLLLISLWFHPNVGAILLEGLWAVIALVMLLRIVWTRR